MSGYSGPPLAKKLGITPESEVLLLGAPAGFKTNLEPLPAGVRFISRVSANVDLAHVFVTAKGDLADRLVTFRRTLKPDTPVWISWPKKSSGVPSTVTEDVIREVALPLGYVDIKVCAVNDVWSGLKLVVRKELR
ncbi:MAG TPA: DUF3052 family protein [Candidatus Polarisedimenticolaceae bacterium]|nr:DUF3052 family protein [Candidatus Polarisedimenticolaceae bacterium]